MGRKFGNQFPRTRDAGCRVPDAGTRDAGCRVPGVLLPRGNGFSVLRIFLTGECLGDWEPMASETTWEPMTSETT